MHPKNSTPPSPTQYRMLTRSTDFLVVDGENRNPFSVVQGIPVEESLNMAFGLLSAANHVATAGIDRPPEVNDMVAIRFLVSASQALVLASIPAIEQGGAQ